MSHQNCLGSYGEWIADLIPFPGDLSYLKRDWGDLGRWREHARAKTRELLAIPTVHVEKIKESVRILERGVFEGLEVELLSWQLPHGPRTLAYFLKPEGVDPPLPGILALHDHGGVKYFGKRKIARNSGEIHPHISGHQKTYYQGRAWANELARRGYGVLVHDVFPFASRRIEASELPAHVVKRMMRPPEAVEELTTDDITADSAVTEYDVPTDEPGEDIFKYDAFAAQHEHIVAKSLFSAGTTWPGLFLCEDLLALEVLADRPDIDSSRLGCGGLSGGGLRTNYLAGLDDRIRCAVTVGSMSTWRDFVLNISFTHTWMIYIPLLPRYLEYPEVLGMRVPLPTLVQCATGDPLFTPGGMQRATDILSEVYAKAGSSQCLQVSFFDGPHRFDRSMQNEAFAWFDRWLQE